MNSSNSWRTPLPRFLINGFLMFHLVAIMCWALPFQSPVLLVVRNFVRPYFVWAGLFQSWDMFSPSPKSFNTYVDAIVIHQNGETQNWTFPRLEEMSLTDRYFKERYRKYVETMQEDTYSFLWADAARFIARLNNDPSDPVTRVYLVRHSSKILLASGGTANVANWKAEMFYRYSVEPDDLK